MEHQESITGGCFCGQVRYENSGKILNAGLCHCVDCQRLTGGAAWPFFVVFHTDLKVTGDVVEFPRTGASGHEVHMGSCAACGSRLFGRSDHWAKIRTVSASSLDNASLFTPKMHLWTAHAPGWTAFVPGLPKFEHNPPIK